LVSLLAVSGCSSRYLTWRAQGPAAPQAGKIAIVMTDHREPRKGGERPEEIGIRTNAWGIPAPIVLGVNEFPQSIVDFVAQAALAGGIGVTGAQDGGATARVVVDVQTFWCTGYNPVFKANITAGVSIVDPATGAVRMAAVPLMAEGGGMNCRSIYRKLLSDLFHNAQALFATPEVHAAVLGAPMAAPGVPPPAGQ
jgi:hypothetical protein